ncbi:hypothetical protein LARV_01022 [Longilinea arvoryzae]|uniref:Uncharacterized protein n=1 Tax=Longilinea arvoryzae TaxID=360412 RepID=A0A0S7BHL1_9CHLR|nr:hypothetical protein LARV_01022 [Longilinea arvoryzae]
MRTPLTDFMPGQVFILSNMLVLVPVFVRLYKRRSIVFGRKNNPPGMIPWQAGFKSLFKSSNKMTYFTSLFCRAMATASVRLATPSLERMLET